MGVAVSNGRLFASSAARECVRVFAESNLALLATIHGAGNRGVAVHNDTLFACYDVRPDTAALGARALEGAITMHSASPPHEFRGALTDVHNSYGVCVEPSTGCIYVTERWSNRVSLFALP